MPVLKEEVKNITIRLPVSLYQEILGEAKENRRSVNQQIVYILEHKPRVVKRGPYATDDPSVTYTVIHEFDQGSEEQSNA